MAKLFLFVRRVTGKCGRSADVPRKPDACNSSSRRFVSPSRLMTITEDDSVINCEELA